MQADHPDDHGRRRQPVRGGETPRREPRGVARKAQEVRAGRRVSAAIPRFAAGAAVREQPCPPGNGATSRATTLATSVTPIEIQGLLDQSGAGYLKTTSRNVLGAGLNAARRQRQ